MQVPLFWSDKLRVPTVEKESLFRFLQSMANRIMVGHPRYGSPNPKKKYMTRIELELKAYKKTGNQEHLANIANYCWLESYAPQHPKSHHDATVTSATRGKV